MTVTKTQVLTKGSLLKEMDFEEITTEEEAAIEEGRKAYNKGEWKNFTQLKHELGSTNHIARAKKS